MDIKKLERRDASLDIIRIVAAFFVLSIHFLLHTGFYTQSVSGAPMYVMSMMRTLFSTCVPLFIVLSGYLLSNKTLSRSYYKGIRITLLVYLFASAACIIFKSTRGMTELNFKNFILGILNYTGTQYAWYIEMYIGLFLLAPFLNLMYHGLQSQSRKRALVITLVAVTILPTLFNIYNFDSIEWWADPKLSEQYAKIIPSFWIMSYPLAYYFTGSYIREFGLKLRSGALLGIFFGSLLLFTVFNIYRCRDGVFKEGVYVTWGGFEPYVLTLLLFTLLSRIKTDKFSDKLKWCLWKLSDLTLGIYLFSYIFDILIYTELNAKVPIVADRLPYYFLTVPACFIGAAVAAYLARVFAEGIILIWDKISASRAKKSS